MGSALVDTALAQAIHELDGKALLSAGVSRTLSRMGHVVAANNPDDGEYIARTADRVLTDILHNAGVQAGATRIGLCPEYGDDERLAAPHESDEPVARENTVDGVGDEERDTVDMSEEEVERSFTREQIRELALEAIHAQRDALLQARDEGVFSSAALEGALARLDNEEILLVSSRGSEH